MMSRGVWTIRHNRTSNFVFSIYDVRFLFLMAIIVFATLTIYQNRIREPVGRKYFAVKDGRRLGDNYELQELLTPEELRQTNTTIGDVME